MNVVPLNDKILVQRLEAEDKTAGGILLPDTAKEKPKQGKVLSLGEGKRLENGSRAAFQVKVDDRVLFSSWAGNEVTVVVIVLGIIGLSAFVLDAFEIIFVVVPIVLPPLLIRVAGWDLLSLKRDPKAQSYWVHRTPPGPEPDSLKNMF